MSYFSYKNNILYCEKVKISDIADKYGTPAYIYSKKTLSENFDAYANAFDKKSGLICFSVKSLSNLSILKFLSEKGSGFDIVSGGELERTLLAGVDPKKIIFTGIAKTDEEILFGIEKNILSFNIESKSEMMRIEKIARDKKKLVDVAIRFNPEIDAGGHEYIKTGRKKDKFGILVSETLKLAKYISNSEHLNLIGLSCHIGSQIFELDDFKAAANFTKKLAEEVNKMSIELKFLDVGGGLGISYTSISGNAGIMISKIEYIKENYLIIDAGMNDLIRPALYNAKHSVINTTKGTGNNGSWTIVGPICESSDVLAKDYEMEAAEGDIIAVETAGAYGHVMSSNYNSRRKPPEILVSNDKYELIRKRETYEDLLKNEVDLSG